MDKELYRLACEASSQVYIDHIDLGTTEFKLTTVMYHDEYIQILAIAGTNEFLDWRENFSLWSKKGIKKAGVDAAVEVMMFPEFYTNRDSNLKLLVCGHSKAGPTVIAFKRLFNADWCVAFAPARSLRRWVDRRMKNTTIFIDPDDPVSKASFINFGHPICTTIFAEDDHRGLYIGDHYMYNWVEFVESL